MLSLLGLCFIAIVTGVIGWVAFEKIIEFFLKILLFFLGLGIFAIIGSIIWLAVKGFLAK